MKNWLAILLALAMALSLAACGQSAENAQEAQGSQTQEQEAPSGSTEEDRQDEAAETEQASTEEETEIYVFLAASLSNAFDELTQLYYQDHPQVKITLNADSSGTLLSQIEEGYECDIFFSAANKQMQQLEEDGLMVEGSRVDLLQNQVVLITWKDSGTAVTGLDNLDAAASMALADGSVPAGNYTRVALQAMGVLDSDQDSSAISSEAVSQALGGLEINECSNVSKVLQAVVEGSNEVGTVYYSDAYSEIDRLEILEYVSTDLTGAIIYPVAQVVNPEADEVQTQAAADFLAFLQTDEAMEVFERYMFLDHR